MKIWLRQNRGVFVFLLLFAFLRTALADWNPIPSGSMRPTLLEGDVVLVNRVAYDLKLPLSDIMLVRMGEPRRGDVVTFTSPADGVRLIGSFTLPILTFAVLVYTDAPRWTVFTILAFELAVGGLDNLLSHHKVATLALAWGGRVLGVSLLLGGALILQDQAAPLSIVAAIVSVFGVSAEFIRGRAYYIDHLME